MGMPTWCKSGQESELGGGASLCNRCLDTHKGKRGFRWSFEVVRLIAHVCASASSADLSRLETLETLMKAEVSARVQGEKELMEAIKRAQQVCVGVCGSIWGAAARECKNCPILHCDGD